MNMDYLARQNLRDLLKQRLRALAGAVEEDLTDADEADLRALLDEVERLGLRMAEIVERGH